MERKPEYLKIIEIPDGVKLKVLPGWCLTSESHLEMRESEVNMEMVFHHISLMGFTANASGSFCVVYFGSVAYYFVRSLC